MIENAFLLSSESYNSTKAIAIYLFNGCRRRVILYMILRGRRDPRYIAPTGQARSLAAETAAGSPDSYGRFF